MNESIVVIIVVVVLVLAIAGAISRSRRLRRAEETFNVAELTRLGWRIETETAREVVIVRSHRVNHLLHFVVGIFTLGLWWIVWIVLAIFAGEKRRTFTKPEHRRNIDG